ncbi:hypothetical protein HMPREF3185_02074 [Porphyromonas somerae]|uniref:Uncharacterized protein n=1 Tax=Porphyromonas somerae TaxID=322095 RepID=A0A134B070_9PORP|nr:hypothetical protein HMPREF3184_02074 [Porphyromonadaceae bacterium KA00676]KXB73332.1 hypothetical protein HMPREF3185_02074 [Porphyromonas somerae]
MVGLFDIPHDQMWALCRREIQPAKYRVSTIRVGYLVVELLPAVGVVSPDGSLTTDPEEAGRLHAVTAGYVPQWLALIEGGVGYGLAVAEAIACPTLVPELIADEPVVVGIKPRSHRVVVGEGQRGIGGAEATSKPFTIHRIEVGSSATTLVVGAEAIKREDDHVAVLAWGALTKSSGMLSGRTAASDGSSGKGRSAEERTETRLHRSG